jgi:CHRD domain
MKLKTTLALSIFSLAAAQPTLADDDHGLNAHLVGFKEVPSISTGASGEFKAQVNDNGTAIDWELNYKDLEGEVQQAHIHFAQRGVNGGITVFLCTNLGNGPTGIQACPAAPATITGTIMAADVSPDIKATEMARMQGINTGEFDELLRAIRAGATYANVHSTTWPGGEVRGQIRPGGQVDPD